MCSSSRRGVALLVATGLVSLSGCMHRPELKDRNPTEFNEVGAVNVAAVSVAPFATLLKSLENDFFLKPDDAIKQAIAVTQATTLSQDNATQAMLRLALGPAVSASATQSTKTDSDGLTTTESQSQTNRISPDPSRLGVPPIPTAATASAPATAAAGEHNAMLRYQLATALRQEVAMLNSYVRDAPRLKDHDAYVVRFQVSVRPAARRTPFDAQVDIALSSSEGEGPIVVPLLVTDSQDASSVSSMQRNLTQLGLAIGSLKGSFGALGEFGSRSEDVVTALGWHYQSSFNVTKLDDHTLSLRAYAMPTGYDRFELMPRVYHLTALVLAKRDGPNQKVTYTPAVTFWHAINGKPLRPDIEPTAKVHQPNIKESKFELPYWPNAVFPSDQRLVVQVEGSEAPYKATIKLRGGSFLRSDTFTGAEISNPDSTKRTIAADVNVGMDGEARSSLDVIFRDLSDDDLKTFKETNTMNLILHKPRKDDCQVSSKQEDPKPSCRHVINLGGPAVVFGLKKDKAEPMSSLKVGKTMLVKADGTAEITAATTVSEKSASKVAAVEVDFDTGLPGRILSPRPDCASIIGSKLRLVGTCNVTMQLRNVKPVVLEMGKASPTLKVGWAEVLADATRVPGDAITVEMQAYERIRRKPGNRKKNS